MKLHGLFLLLIMGSVGLLAQPAGGIRIMRINSLFDEPIVKDDPALKITVWQLSANKHKPVKRIADAVLKDSSSYSFPPQTRLYLPPFIVRKGKRIGTPNQRLQLIHGKDTMIIDFFGIATEHDTGYSDQLDHIDFTPGHFRYEREPWKHPGSVWNHPQTTDAQRKQIGQWLHKGIDSETIRMLGSIDILTYTLPAGQHYLLQKHSRPACSDTASYQGYRKLCYEQIQLRDSTVYIHTTATPTPGDSGYYKLLFYQISDLWFNRPQIRLLPEEEEAPRLLKALTKGPLHLNGTPFTGCMKLAVGFANAGISARYSGYNVYVLCFKEGKLLSSRLLPDVELRTEHRLVRPT